MDELDDIKLLGRFVEQHSEADFAALVQRQINLVYSAALRQTRNPHAAEEITQAVFMVLARKAGSLLRLRTLTGWLYQATRLTAANYLRTESRRARRDQEAYMQSLMNEPAECSEETWRQTAPLLESAMGELNRADRDAVLLRYFENKSLRDVGLELGINEDAARMRVNRALERLRRFLTRRDVNLSAAALAGVLATKTVAAAPVNLAASVAAAVGQGVTAASSVAVLAKGTLNILAWARYKMIVGLGASAVFVAAVITTPFLLHSKTGPQRTRSGPIAQLGPFSGAVSDGFDALGAEVTRQGIGILGGAVTVSNLTDRGALKIVAASSMGGRLVTAHSPPFILGQIGVSEWVFSTPLAKFGAWFANNSRFDDARVDFYDVNDAVIASETARSPKSPGGWTWNGWQSDVPIHRMVVTGNDAGLMHGFIWFDDVQIVTAPQPLVTNDVAGRAPSPPPAGEASVENKISPRTESWWNTNRGMGGERRPFSSPTGRRLLGRARERRGFIASTIACSTNIAVCNDPGQAGAVVRFSVQGASDGAALGLTCVPPSGSFFPVGTNFVQCRATNETGDVTTRSYEITVHDCEPPVIHSIAASPDVLRPSNRRMEEVRVRVDASDNCHLARCQIISVSCCETIPADGTAHTTGEWEITGDLTVNLSSERPSANTARVYSITVECSDDSGNSSTADVQVTVPPIPVRRPVPIASPPHKIQYALRDDS